MPRFFTQNVQGEKIILTGEDAQHIGKALRMAPGEALVVCDTATDIEYFCKIQEVQPQAVTLRVDGSQHSAAEPDVQVHLYQALPKGDKMELIIQKAVELGVGQITPVLTRRCVSRPDGKSLGKKGERWQKIALEAAKQSGRGHIPRVNPALEYGAALEEMAAAPRALLFYELGGGSLKGLLRECPRQLSVMIGAEGGFDRQEVDAALKKGILTATLGKRILRCETAPLCALSVIMFETGNLE